MSAGQVRRSGATPRTATFTFGRALVLIVAGLRVWILLVAAVGLVLIERGIALSARAAPTAPTTAG